MPSNFPAHFARQYDSHLKHLKLKGLQPKTIDAYARAIRRLGGISTTALTPCQPMQVIRWRLPPTVVRRRDSAVAAETAV